MSIMLKAQSQSFFAQANRTFWRQNNEGDW